MSKKNLLILGGGQYGTVVKETAEAMGVFGRIDFLDDNNETAVGKIADVGSFAGEYACGFVALGNAQLRSDLTAELKKHGYELPVIRHPSAVVMPSADIRGGTVLEANTVVNSGAVIAEGCLISAGAVINHNAVVQEYCHVDCNATVPARSVVAARTKVPCGTVFAG